jgi:hypothetical protein
VENLVVALLVLHLLAPISAHAAGDLTNYSLKHWGFILGMALLGGLVNWWGQVRRGEIPAAKISNLVGELATSAFAGLVCFFICEWANFPQLLTAAMTGIFGHMGTRGVSVLEKWAENKLPGKSPPSPPET